jgi:hypothetical protein
MTSGVWSTVTECLPNRHEALGWIPSPGKKKKIVTSIAESHLCPFINLEPWPSYLPFWASVSSSESYCENQMRQYGKHLKQTMVNCNTQ